MTRTAAAAGHPIRVLHVLDHSIPVVSGYSIRSRSILRAQRTLGLEASALTSPKHGGAADIVERLDGVSYHRTADAGAGRLGVLPLVTELRLVARLARRICEVAGAERPVVLHAHSPSLNGLAALRAARRLALPLVYESRAFWEDAAVDLGRCTSRSLRYRLSRAVETRLFRDADRVVLICEAMRREVAGRGVPAGRLTVVPNGVDPDWLQAGRPVADGSVAALSHRLRAGGGPVFGFIGSLYRYEGVPFLLEAMPRLAATLPGARLLVVGAGPDEAVVRARSAAVGDRVVVVPTVSPAAVRDLYGLVDVLVYPRRRNRLTELVTPLKPLEAMAMGKAVLASDVGGLRELVRDEVTGLLFTAESQDGLVAQALRLAGDGELRRRLGEAARREIAAERRWERLVARYGDLYRDLAEVGRCAPSC